MHTRIKRFLFLLVVFLTTALISFFTASFFHKLYIKNSKQHSILYDESSFEANELTSLKKIFDSFEPDADIKLSVKTKFSIESLPSPLILSILVPITNFNDPTTVANPNDQTIKFIPIQDLSPSQKLLTIEDQYYLDSFKTGAKFRILDIHGEKTQKITDHLRANLPKFPDKESILSFNQTGVTALSRRLNSKFRSQNFTDTFSTKIANFLKSTDLTHVSNEVSFMQNCHTDSTSTQLCASPESLKILQNIGTDIVEMTGNHHNDHGSTRMTRTLETYHKNNIQTFGGGKNLAEAQQPLNISQKSSKITLLGYNYSTSTTRNGEIATHSSPGANPYSEATVANQIKAAKSNSNIVIVSVQFFECYSYPEYGQEMPECDKPIRNQTDFFRHLVDLGADIVIGTQAHQAQTYELYQNKPIFYGLGNLFFDQINWPGTTRSLVLTHYFYNNKHLQTRISPTIYDKNFTTRLMTQKESEQFLARLLRAKPQT